MASITKIEGSPINSGSHKPYRTELAIEILQHLSYIETTFNSEFIKKDGRDLTKEEEALKSATINCLRQYITGEINLGDCGYTDTKPLETSKTVSLKDVEEEFVNV